MRYTKRMLLLMFIGSSLMAAADDEVLASLRSPPGFPNASVIPATDTPAMEIFLSVVPATIQKGDQEVAAFKMIVTVKKRGQSVSLSSAGTPVGKVWETIAEANPCQPAVVRVAVIQYTMGPAASEGVLSKVSFPPPGATSRNLVELYFSAVPSKLVENGVEFPAYAASVTARRDGQGISLVSDGVTLNSRYETLFAQAAPCPPKQLRVTIVEAAPRPADPSSLPAVASLGPIIEPANASFSLIR